MENIVMIPIEKIWQHRDNPRKDLGDLTELTASIRANGIYQNLTVVPAIGEITKKWDGESYRVIIGHRRLAAARAAGLEKVPCAVVEMSLQKQVETMILENMQRADLTIPEQVKGFQQLLDFGDTIEQIAEKTGFSVKTIKRRTEIARLDPDTLDQVMKARGKQLTLEEFDKLTKIDDIKIRNKLLQDIGTKNFNYVLAAERDAQETKKMIPEIKNWIDINIPKGTRITEYEAWNYDMLHPYPGIRIKDWKPGRPDNIPGSLLEKLEEPGEVYFVFTEGGYFRLYKKRKPVVIKESKKSKKEIEKEKQMEAACSYLEKQSALAYGLRKEFIEKLEITKNNMAAVLEGAFLAGLINALSWRGSDVDGDEIRETLHIDNDDGRSYGLAAIKKYIRENDNVKKRLPLLVWYMFGDSEDLLNYSCGRDWKWPEYEEDETVIALYYWLGKLGYQISEVERGLIEGTDINLHLGDAEAAK
ncbi:MAG: ParB/RepB/Spo0J family partition protein [Acidaminococcaceae bacterium]|nr:ParB/RepB/Spo0J family partition protein [Acidaminococcaceae bacterium]